MPNFAYTARDEHGSQIQGTLVANSAAEATQQLRATGKYPTSIKAVTLAQAESARAATEPSAPGLKLPRAEVIQFSTQLSIMIETGVTLTDALECIATQSEKPSMKKLARDLSTHVQGGSDLSSAMARHPKTFPRLYVALIRAAEKSGMLAKLLNRATNYIRDEQETLRRVKGALTYPGIMLGFAVTTTIFLLAFVLPRFTVIYANKGAALPLPTKLLMGASSFIVGNWPALIVGTVVAAIGTWFYLRTPRGKRTLHFTQLNLPLLGSMFRKLHLSRGMRMIGTMAGAGVSLVDCVETARDLCDNIYFRKLWDDVSSAIQTGKQLSEPLSQNRLVPGAVTQMIHSGERSGKLAFVMEQVATFSEQELKEKIAELTRYIEPAMIVIMGLIIGGVALALMLPIFTISKVVAH